MHLLQEIPATIWVISLVTLLINFSSVMIFSLSPLYLTQVFGLAVFHLGILEGVIEFVSWSTRIFSGIISDYLNKRKPLLIIAYTMTFISRPIFAMAPSIMWIYVAKLTDRISNGIQATPREALIGDAAPKDMKGTCYGLRQSLGVIGSVIGALAVMVLMRSLNNDYSTIFWLASFPSLIALLALVFFVKDVKTPSSGGNIESKKRISFVDQIKQISRLDSSFWMIILVTAVFMISNYNASYRILQAEKLGFLAADVSLIMIIQNLGVMLAAFPMGRLSDSFDKRVLLSIGFIITIASNLCFWRSVLAPQLQVQDCSSSHCSSYPKIPWLSKPQVNARGAPRYSKPFSMRSIAASLLMILSRN